MLNGQSVATFVATNLLGYIVKTAERKRISYLSDNFWWDFQVYEHLGHSSLKQDRDDYGFIFREDYDDLLKELVDWCFKTGIDAKAIWQYGTRLSQGREFHRRSVIYHSDRANRRVEDENNLHAMRQLQQYMQSRDYADCELAFRQIANALNKNVNKAYRKYGDMRKASDANQELAANITEIMQREVVADTTKARWSSRKWREFLIKEYRIKKSHTYIANLEQFRKYRVARKIKVNVAHTGHHGKTGVADATVYQDEEIEKIDDRLDSETEGKM